MSAREFNKPERFKDGSTAKAMNKKSSGEVEDEADLEAGDDEYADSTFGSDNSDSTSISSSIYQGHIENGRRYQSKREGEYYQPSDEKQSQAQEKAHIVHCILDSNQENPFFYSPIPEKAQILDVGSGTGAWARDTADRFPSASVHGVDLAPVPDSWMPPNCRFEVDDILKSWEVKQSFDLVHLRYMYGAFTDEDWRRLYQEAYKQLEPGGWIEQSEPSIVFSCDDGTLPTDSVLAQSGAMFIRCCEASGKKIDTVDTFKSRIEAAGFTNFHEKSYKVPVGGWAKNPLLKEAGQIHKAHLVEGFEGYAMFLLTHFGSPAPWSPEEVQVYVAKIREDLNNPAYHSYNRFKRVWAQKPYDVEPPTQKLEAVSGNAA